MMSLMMWKTVNWLIPTSTAKSITCQLPAMTLWAASGHPTRWLSCSVLTWWNALTHCATVLYGNAPSSHTSCSH
jgi:hypothetical protein